MQKKYPEDKDLYNFHYNREERLSRKPELTEYSKGKKGWLKGNKALVIILLDIFVLVLIWVIVVPFVPGRKETGELSGYHFSIVAFRYDKEVLFSLKCRSIEEENPQVTSPSFTARILLGKLETVKTWALPPPGKEEIFRIRIPDREGASSVKVQILHQGEELEISNTIKGE